MSPCSFKLYAEYIMRKAELEESQAGIKTAGRNINNLQYADDTSMMAESEEELNESERGECKKLSEAQHQKNQDCGHWPHHLLTNRRGRYGGSERFYSSTLTYEINPYWNGGRKSKFSQVEAPFPIGMH